MRYWVVRAKPAWNEPFEEWIVPRSIGRWQTTRPPRTWEKGDRMFVWASSPQQEIVGLGVLHALPTKPDRNGSFWFRIKYLSGVLQNPLPRSALSRNPILRKSILLKHGPAFSVVRLTDSEGEALYRLVAQQNPETSSIWPELQTSTPERSLPFPDPDYAGKEGRKSLRAHIQRERDPKLVKSKRNAVLAESGKLECEVCGFDFFKKYGKVGKGFCEVHHLLPLAETGNRTTKLSDLAVVCSNCHRIIHRKRIPLSLHELRDHIKGKTQQGDPGGSQKRSS